MNLYVAGMFTNAGGVRAPHVARWDGSGQSAVGGSVVGGGTVNSLAVIGTNLFAAGTFTNMGGGAGRPQLRNGMEAFGQVWAVVFRQQWRQFTRPIRMFTPEIRSGLQAGSPQCF